MMVKKPFTLDQHIRFGFPLKLTSDFIVCLLGELRLAYPTNSCEVKHAKAALKALDRLKSELDDRVCEENPNTDSEITLDIYYGSRWWTERDEVFALFDELKQELTKSQETPHPAKGKGSK